MLIVILPSLVGEGPGMRLKNDEQGVKLVVNKYKISQFWYKYAVIKIRKKEALFQTPLFYF